MYDLVYVLKYTIRYRNFTTKRTVFRACESIIATLGVFRQICEHRKHLCLQAARIHTCTYRLTKGRVRYTSLVGR
jgi:hypothetical protein